MLNHAVIMGRLTSDPELRTTPSGTSVTNFTVACNRDYGSNDEKRCNFIDVVAWRGTAEFVTKYFHKGSMIIVQGEIQTRNYEDKNGYSRKAVEIVSDTVYFGEPKRKEPDESSRSSCSPPKQEETPPYRAGEFDDFQQVDFNEFDDLPFD